MNARRHNQSRLECWFWPLLALSLLIGLGLRSLWLDWQPIWWDEGYSIYFATESITQMLALTARDIHPPLYYALLHAWITLTNSTTPATLRILSVLISALTLPVYTWLAQLLFQNRLRTLLATLLLAVSPMHIFYSQEMRMYGLAMLLSLIATALYWKLIQQPSTLTLLGYSLAISLTLYTIYYSALLILAHAIWGLWHFRRNLKQSRLLIAAYLLASLLYLPWVLYTATNLIRYVGEKIGFDNDTPLVPLQYLWRHLIAFTAGHLPSQNATLAALALLGLVSLLLLLGYAIFARLSENMGLPVAAGKNEPSPLLSNLAARPAICCFLAIPIVIGFLLNIRLPFFPHGGERLLLFVLPYFLLLVADGIVICFESRADQTTKTGRVGWATGIVALSGLLLSASIGIYTFYTIDRYADRDYRPVIEQVVQQGRDDDTLLAIFPWQVGYWRAYAPAALRDQDPLLLGQSSLEWSDTIRQQIDHVLADGGTLWFPAPLSLGSDLPLEIEHYLQQLVQEPAEGEIQLSNVEMRWVNESTRLSAWQSVPTESLSKAELPTSNLLADFGDLQLLAAKFSPHEIAAANRVIHIATEWNVSAASTISLAELEHSETVEASETVETDSLLAPREWQFSLRLLDDSGRVAARRSFRELGRERWTSHAGLVVPTGLTSGVYTLVISVDRVDVNRVDVNRVDVNEVDVNEVDVDGGEEVVTALRAQLPNDPDEPTESVFLGNVSIIQPAESPAPYRLPIQRRAAPPIVDNGLTLLGLSGIDAEKSLLAGTRISLDIFILFQNHSAPPPDRLLYVSLLDRTGAGVAGGESGPLALGSAGSSASIPFEFNLPATLASGDYRLIAGLLDPATGVKSVAKFGAVEVEQRAASFDAPLMMNKLPSPALFGTHAELLGYDAASTGEDNQLSLTLHWHVMQPLLPQHNIFVHWVGADGGNMLAQWDGVPQGSGATGALIWAPTGSWQTDEFLSTRHLLPLVGNDDPVLLNVGLYVPETGARLPVTVDGTVVGDFVQIEPFRLKSSR